MSATKIITIAGAQFEVAQPYVAGPHELTEGEAAALNQTRAENIRNNMATKVKEGTSEDGTVSEEVKALVAQYDAEYSFAVREAGQGRVVDPVETEARKIARAAINAKLRAEGRAVKSVDKEVMEAAITQVAATEAVMKAAAKAVRERSKAAESALDGVSF